MAQPAGYVGLTRIYGPPYRRKYGESRVNMLGTESLWDT
jgi:hypothetical protein